MGSEISGEAGKRYALLTRELGLVYAQATGVRKISSKLRFILHDFAYVKADLVQGKNFWRITSASSTGQLERIVKRWDTLQVFANIAALLKRLLPAQGENSKLFADLIQGLIALEQSETAEELRNIETIVVLRMLADLGYIGEGDSIKNFVTSPLEAGLVYKVSAARREILRHINQALRASHL